MPAMAPVIINVYDLAPHNTWTYWCGVGIFHSGVEVYGVEFAYGGAQHLFEPVLYRSNHMQHWLFNSSDAERNSWKRPRCPRRNFVPALPWASCL